MFLFKGFLEEFCAKEVGEFFMYLRYALSDDFNQQAHKHLQHGFCIFIVGRSVPYNEECFTHWHKSSLLPHLR
jgi:hypothetical protein